ncbi:MAG: PilZ domain-containing protein [Thermodesulfovibrionales bacterium]
MRRRQCHRYTKRLETTFSSGHLSFRGISSDLSASGLFIRTQHGFVPNTIVNIEIYLPDNKISRLKGIVRRCIKTTMPGVKNGMGIELIERDTNYLDFVKTIVTEKGEESFEKSSEEIGAAKEKVREEGNKKQGETDKKDSPPEYVLIICENCNVKNKVPVNRRFGLKCGKCGVPLRIGEIG